MLTPTGDMDLRKIGQARNTLMDVKLSQVRIYFCYCLRFFALFKIFIPFKFVQYVYIIPHYLIGE